MPIINDTPTDALHGIFHDVLRDAAGNVIWDSGLRRNTIVTDCRVLLASFMRGSPAVVGVGGLQVGAGLAAWDSVPPPAPSPGTTALMDPFPFTLPPAGLALDFIDPISGSVSPTPTQRLQIRATLGPGVPAWPDANHPSSTLREFGLTAQIGAATVLVNAVRHPAIAKDPLSTLERTVWLVF